MFRRFPQFAAALQAGEHILALDTGFYAFQRPGDLVSVRYPFTVSIARGQFSSCAKADSSSAAETYLLEISFVRKIFPTPPRITTANSTMEMQSLVRISPPRLPRRKDLPRLHFRSPLALHHKQALGIHAHEQHLCRMGIPRLL